MPVLLLRRAFGHDCFEVYMQSTSHNPAKGGKAADKGGKAGKATPGPAEGGKAAEGVQGAEGALGALRLGGGTWEASSKVALSDAQYLPLQVLRF